MKLSKFLFFLSVFALLFVGCKKDDDKDDETSSNPTQALSGSSLLVSKNWESVKIFNSGIDVTSQVSSINYDFKSDKTYTSSSSSGSSNGVWSLSDNNLVLDGNKWTILELIGTSLKIEDNTATVKIFFQ